LTLLHLEPGALSRCRFGLSPLAETVGSLIALHRPCTDPWLRAWHTTHQAAYRTWLGQDPVAAGLVPLLAATKWLPDLVAIPPAGGMSTRLVDELTAVAAHDDRQVRATVADAVDASWEPQITTWLSLAGLGPRVAAVLQQGWDRFVGPDWPRRRAVLERDVMHRAGLLAAYGWQHAVEDLTGTLSWAGPDTLRFGHEAWPDRRIGDDGLVFVPRTTGGGAWTCEQPPRYALVYPARGPAAPARSPSTDTLAATLGPGRARVVRELTRPATSSQLAAALTLSLGTISAHLAVLRDADIATGARVGRHVIYRLTDRGTELVRLLLPETAQRPDS
jgi:DNA-binding transcriptional ArsR family regulator